MFFRPTYVDKILAYKDAPLAKVLTGVRRCGKSTILKMVIERLKELGVPSAHILSYSFDSLDCEAIRNAKKLFDEVKPHLSKDCKTYLFFDEIQEVESWERAVNALLSDYNVDIYITGSNSRMMSSEISTYLTGRYISFPVFTLSFAEYLEFRSAFSSRSTLHAELANYLRFGGFPATHLKDYAQEEIYTIVKDIYSSTIYTDIVRRNRIRRVDQLERIVRFTFDNVGRTFSAAAISKYLKSERRVIDNETVYSYLSKLEAAYILYRCSRYDVRGKELLKTQEKFYVADTALRYSVLGYTPDSVSVMLENVVYLELLRRGYSVNVGKLGDAEVDFIATKRDERLYIQIAQRISSCETEFREYGRLLDIRDNYPKYVLSTDDYAGGNYKGIKTMHVADFLLSKEF